MIERVKNVLAEYFAGRAEVLFAYLHGSVLERLNPNDIDIAVYVDESRVPRERVIDYELRQSVALDRVVQAEADLKVLNYCSAAFGYHASAGILVYCREDQARYTFLENTWREYFDYLPHAKQFLRDILGP